MTETSGIDWGKVERTRKARTCASRTCPICGREIREGAWGSRESNWRKHAAAHERRGEVNS